MADLTVISAALSSNAYTSNEKPIDMHSRVFKNFPEMFPIQAILTRLSEGTTNQSTVYWSESEKMPTTFYISTAATDSATTIIVPNYTYLRIYDVIYLPETEEQLRVKATPTTSSVSVARATGGTTGVAILAGAVGKITSSAFEESQENITARQVVNSEYYNYTQEILDMIKTSRRTMNEATHFGPKGTKRMENQSKLFYAWREKLEYAIMLAHRESVAGPGGTNIVKVMGGLNYWLKNGTNYFDVNGVLTESLLDSYLVRLYTAMPDEYPRKLACIASPKVIGYINQMAKPLIRISPNSTMYGLQLNQYQGACNLDLIPHPLLTGPVMEEWAYIIDFDYLSLKYQERARLERDVYHHAATFVVDQMYALVTMLLGNEKRHGMMVRILG
jgi:hypothetical protein